MLTDAKQEGGLPGAGLSLHEGDDLPTVVLVDLVDHTTEERIDPLDNVVGKILILKDAIEIGSGDVTPIAGDGLFGKVILEIFG